MKRLPTSRDLLDLAVLEEVVLSPDGRTVVWVVKTIDEVHDQYLSAVWGTSFDGGPARRLTTGPGQDHSPAWSPDGRWLAFLSDRASRTEAGLAEIKERREENASFPERIFQVWLLPRDGGEAHQVTFMERGAGRPVWAPDGRRLVFAASLGSSDQLDTRSGLTGPAAAGPSAGAEADHSTATAPRSAPRPDRDTLYAKHNRDVRAITRIAYKYDGLGFLDERRTHVFSLELGDDGAPLGAPTRLTDGDWNHGDPVFSPDGKRLAFTGVRVPDPHRADLEPWDRLYVMPAQGGEVKEVAGAKGPCAWPAWSPDGRRLAFVGHERPHGWYSTDRLWLVEVRDDARPPAVCLTPDFEPHLADHSLTDLRENGAPARPVWTADGRSLVFLASSRGSTQLYRLPVDRPAPPEAVTDGDRVIYGYSLSADAVRAALAVTSPLEPGDVYVLQLDADAGRAAQPLPPETRLTWINAPALSHVCLAPATRFGFSSDGLAMDAWIMMPPRTGDADGPAESRSAGVGPPDRPAADRGRCPAVVQIHGGPMAMYGSAFFLEFQLLAASGCAVIYGNPRGSTGYGEDFCRAIRGDWGDLDYKDILAMTDTALARYPTIDPRRLGVAGGSYGGFMVNWIIGHTERFAAAVTMRSVVSFTSDFGTCDVGYLQNEDLGCHPWEDPELYRRLSPIAYVTEARTPVLILHSEDDHRCAVSQAEELFAALKKLGRTVELVRFPGESHGLSRCGKPWHRVFRLDQILSWFGRYLLDKTESPKGAPAQTSAPTPPT